MSILWGRSPDEFLILRAKVKVAQPHFPPMCHRSQFRKPQISIPKSTNHFVISVPRAGVKVRSWSHFPAGSIRIRHRLQTGTDQLRTEYYSSSVALILILVLVLLFLFLFPSFIYTLYIYTIIWFVLNRNIRICHRLQTGTGLNTTPRPSASSSSSFSYPFPSFVFTYLRMISLYLFPS